MRVSRYLVWIWTKGTLTDVRWVVIPSDARYWSQQIHSLTWFKERELHRVFGKGSRGFPPRQELTYIHAEYVGAGSAEESIARSRVLELENDFGPSVNWTTYDNVWDFYDAVGYDRKRKRYNDNRTE